MRGEEAPGGGGWSGEHEELLLLDKRMEAGRWKNTGAGRWTGRACPLSGDQPGSQSAEGGEGVDSVLGARALLSAPALPLGQSGWRGSISVLILPFTPDFNKLPLCATLL